MSNSPVDKEKAKETVREMELALRAAMSEIRPEATVHSRAMFGGAGFYVDGRMIAAWYGNGLALKLPEAARAELLALPGAQPSMSPSYTEVPAVFLADTKRLAPWVARSVAHVESLPEKKRKK